MKTPNRLTIVQVLATLLCCLVLQNSLAAGIDFNLLKATPAGSWQLREDTTTDHKGRQTVTVLRTSMLNSEMRGGKKYYWIEMVMDSYKLNKKGKRKKEGDQVILKTLVAESAMQSDPANIMTNLRGFGEEIIMQSGDEDPMRLSGAGGMMGAMMQMMGTEVNFSFDNLGNENVSVPAGQFDAQKIHGSGTTETKVIFKTIKVESDSTVWMSGKVPFGMIKAEGTSLVNGKSNSNSTQLLEFGLSGAKSQITKEPQDMPNMGNIFGQ